MVLGAGIYVAVVLPIAVDESAVGSAGMGVRGWTRCCWQIGCPASPAFRAAESAGFTGFTVTFGVRCAIPQGISGPKSISIIWDATAEVLAHCRACHERTRRAGLPSQHLTPTAVSRTSPAHAWARRTHVTHAGFSHSPAAGSLMQALTSNRYRTQPKREPCPIYLGRI